MATPGYIPLPAAIAAPQTPAPTPMWQAQPAYGPMPQQTRTPYPTPYLPTQSQPMLPMDPSQDLGYQQWLAQRGLPTAFSGSGQQAAKQDMLEPVKQIAEKKATGWLQDQGTSYLDDIFSSGGGGSGAASQIGSGSTVGADVMSMGQTMPQIGPTITNAGTIPGASSGGAFSMSGVGSAGNAILPLAGALGAYDLWKSNRGARNRGMGAAQGAASGAAMGSYFGPWGTAIGAVGGGIYGATQHESTRDTAKFRTDKVLKKYRDDPEYQNYVAGMRAQYDSAPPDPSKPFAGKYATWDEYKKAGLEAGDLTGVLGNIESFGQDWARLTQDQRQAVTQKMIDADMYESKKGDVLVKDQTKARQIFDSMKQSGFKNDTGSGVITSPDSNFQKLRPVTIDSSKIQNGLGLSGQQPVSGWGGANGPLKIDGPIMIPRSNTRSPGIGKDGKRINYGGK